ncbi:hypothetical protein IscW_ISCW020896 [Ixodes scapularis]|uniref:Uncharacterized protein n=1 Tax=Ixodes scapularis TaxID=6945 RepID=B7Q4K8_IXOSC|nr:hypothetical protein IscW_ISCW020896 [Ixodes scapularis]|eukprot:XP_002400861.1 hypothetical protein IscW_ISCW020896 [Ixodes scapularis]
MDPPFTLHELEADLDKANTRTAPGPDSIAVGQLRNLPTALKETVITEMNKVWDSGQASRRHPAHPGASSKTLMKARPRRERAAAFRGQDRWEARMLVVTRRREPEPRPQDKRAGGPGLRLSCGGQPRRSDDGYKDGAISDPRQAP